MGLLRDRGVKGGTKYRMREKVFAIGDDFWVENEEGEHAFKVDGKAQRGPDCWRSRRRSCTFGTRWRSSATATPSRP
jgi:hypothetical protein